jgi:hypothetical protein
MMERTGSPRRDRDLIKGCEHLVEQAEDLRQRSEALWRRDRRLSLKLKELLEQQSQIMRLFAAAGYFSR